MKIKQQTGVKRIICAAKYSYRGLRHNIINEAAFRQEVILALILLPTALIIDVTKVERILLIFSLVLILIVELLNTAIEATVDRIGLELNALSGLAKDTGSAAVLMACCLCAFTWIIILFF
jgi:diacylglycerol kinase (ATP)